MHILVADDDTASRYLLASLLGAAGHGVTVAEDGVEALELARIDPPDLILTDILMPRMDGYTLCREWRADPVLANVPFVFYSANYAESDDERLAHNLGADLFLVKPMDPDRLLREIERLLKLAERDDFAPHLPEVNEGELLKEYNARLVDKLERQLETVSRTNEELERTTAQLLQAEEALRSVFSASPVAILTLDENGLVTLWNSAAERIFGWSAEEALGRPCPLVSDDGSDCLGLFGDHTGPMSGRRTTIRRRDGSRVDVSVSANRMENGTQPEGVIALFTDLTEQIAAERGLAETVDRLSHMVDGAVMAFAKIVEARDPYTSGHQERVAALAAAIAIEMGFDEDVAAGIRIAGLIHDIGKVYVPAEILTKPRRLTDVEFAIVQMHPQVAYDVLASIEFPWPIADYVIQHHERLDGTGYPHHLTAEHILPGSRVLAVADVVEAMSSHRPYKVAAGIEAALAEVSKNAGVLYDTEAVAACLRLFEERGFVMPETGATFWPSGSEATETAPSTPGSP